jgi:hypothetical protein
MRIYWNKLRDSIWSLDPSIGCGDTIGEYLATEHYSWILVRL